MITNISIIMHKDTIMMLTNSLDWRMMNRITNDELESLSAEERNTILAVIERANQEEELHRPFEGRLMKWTNVMKGWQERWLFLSPDGGSLHYFLAEDKKTTGPRGSLKLVGAVVQPSEEDPLMFAIFPQQGDPFKLRAANAKERQLWIDRIRRVIEKHTEDVSSLIKAATCSNFPPKSKSDFEDKADKFLERSQSFFRKTPKTTSSTAHSLSTTSSPVPGPSECLIPVQILDMNLLLHALNTAHRNFQQINQYCSDGEKHDNIDILKFKAIGQALFRLLDESYNIISKLSIVEE